MIRQFGNIKYYIMCMLAAMGLYSWSGISGHRIFGDDNEESGQQQGTRHSGGHGLYYHK